MLSMPKVIRTASKRVQIIKQTELLPTKQTLCLTKTNHAPSLFFSGTPPQSDSNKKEIEPTFTFLQKTRNRLSTIIKSVKPVGPEKADKTAFSKDFKKFLEEKKIVQLPSLCLQECAIILDAYHGDYGSFMFLKEKGLTSFTLGEKRKIEDPIHDKLLQVLQNPSVLAHNNSITLDLAGLRTYIESYVNHEVFSTMYVSAKQLQLHFESYPKEPLYCLCRWGDAPSRAGYTVHTILIYGVTDKQNILYYDVSDKIDTQKYSRFQEMDIETFNLLRETGPSDIAYSLTEPRSPIFYKKGG